MRIVRAALTVVTWLLVLTLGLGAGLLAQRAWVFRGELEQLADRLTLDVGPESTLLYDNRDNLVSALFEEHRIAVHLEDMSPHLIDAVLVTEDRRFWQHDGIDLRRIVAAALANQRAGEIVQGGSTITQQLVRATLLDRQQTYQRKIKEAILALRLEERYSKRAILEAYLNRVYFGDGYYGVEAAAIGYFGKPVAALDAAESALLAGLIKGPSVYSPTRNPALARERRDVVLEELHSAGLLSDRDFQKAVSVPVKTMLARGDKTGVIDPRHAPGGEYFREAVTRELLDLFGSEAVYTGGLRVYTTFDRSLQRLAENVIATRVKSVPRAGGEPLQGALVALDPRTGYVAAIVGGRNFRETPFNRAIDAKRQPGSAFKPIIFAMALESGFTPGTQLTDLDRPIDTDRGPWLPAGEHEEQVVTLRTGLALSSNRAAAHLLQQVGMQRTVDMARQFGINSPMPAVPSLALGTGELTLMELTSAYGVFANRGIWKKPTMIRRVVDGYGREIYRAPETERRVIAESTAYMMASMMSDVLEYGTATGTRRQGFRLHAAGKTGTSNDYTDAWFVGFTPTIVTGVWFGYDKPRPIMSRGFASVVAVPAWTRFMTAATRGTEDAWFEMPGGLVKVRLCRLSGMLATDRCTLPVYDLPPYDPNNRDVVAASTPVMREGGVYEDVLPGDRVPPPCTLPHGVPPPSMTPSPSDYDPAFGTQQVPSVPGSEPLPPTPRFDPSIPLPPTPAPAPAPRQTTPSIPDPADRPSRIDGTVPPATTDSLPPITPPPPRAKPARPSPPPPQEPPPAPPDENPIIPGAKINKEPPPATEPDPTAPIIPGAKVTKPPPKPPRPPPQQQ